MKTTGLRWLFHSLASFVQCNPACDPSSPQSCLDSYLKYKAYKGDEEADILVTAYYEEALLRCKDLLTREGKKRKYPFPLKQLLKKENIRKSKMKKKIK